jgi:hypothetical protein
MSMAYITFAGDFIGRGSSKRILRVAADRLGLRRLDRLRAHMRYPVMVGRSTP